MKKFRILGIIAIIAILANFIGGLDEDWKDFKRDLKKDKAVQQRCMNPTPHDNPCQTKCKAIIWNDSRFTEQQPCR